VGYVCSLSRAFKYFYLGDLAMNKEIIDNLARKIWMTRKCRILASERLEKIDFLSQCLFMYYSVLVVGLSIWTLFPEHTSTNLSFVSVLSSIGLLCASLFVTSRNFKGRSIALKACYTKLDQLHTRLLILDISFTNQEDVKQKFLEIESTYNELLNGVENHSEYDYFKVLNQTGEKKLTCWQQFTLIAYEARAWMFIICLVVMPLTPLVITISTKSKV
jgi:SMODS and SLOG-associating 2TM effector domain family 5